MILKLYERAFNWDQSQVCSSYGLVAMLKNVHNIQNPGSSKTCPAEKLSDKNGEHERKLYRFFPFFIRIWNSITRV